MKKAELAIKRTAKALLKLTDVFNTAAITIQNAAKAFDKFSQHPQLIAYKKA